MKIRASVSAVVVVALLVLHSPAAFGQAHCRERRNVDSVNPADIKALSDAIQKLKQKNPDRFEFWKNVHGRPKEGPCIHGEEQFLPWHRAMLAYFEEELRAVSGNQCLSLVYWDWTKPATGKKGYPIAFENDFPNSTRNDNSGAAQPAVSPSEIADLMKLQWDRFTEGLEGGPHDGMHSAYVGGDMRRVPTAAKDFIFYAHHANLDRLWAQWQVAHSGQNPANAKFDTRGFPKPTSTEDVLDISRLRYTYDVMRPAVAAAEAVELRPPAYVKVHGGTVTTFPVDIATLDSRSLLVLEKVPVSSEFSEQGIAYLHPESVACKPDDESFVRDYYAGYFFVWERTPGAHSSHPSTRTVILDLGSRFSRLPAAQRKGKWVISVVTSRVPSQAVGISAEVAGVPLNYGNAMLESTNRKHTNLKARGKP